MHSYKCIYLIKLWHLFKLFLRQRERERDKESTPSTANLQSRLLLANPAVLAQTHMATGISTICPIKQRPDVATCHRTQQHNEGGEVKDTEEGEH